MTDKLVYFNSRDRLIRVNIGQIVFFEADGNYTYFTTLNKQKVCLTMNLSRTEETLSKQLTPEAHQFLRIGKRFVVNMNFIYQIDMQKQALILSDFDHFVYQLPISKEALKRVKELLLQVKR